MIDSHSAILLYKLAAPRIGFFLGPHMSRDYGPPGDENPAMGFLWGVDQDETLDL